MANVHLPIRRHDIYETETIFIAYFQMKPTVIATVNRHLQHKCTLHVLDQQKMLLV